MVPRLAEVEHLHQKLLEALLDVFHFLEGAPPRERQSIAELYQLHGLADGIVAQTLVGSSVVANVLDAVAEATFGQEVYVAGPHLNE